MEGEAGGPAAAAAAAGGSGLGLEQATDTSSEVVLIQTERAPPTAEDISDLALFSAWFQGFHGYASIIVCVFGIFTNFFNITILMRKDMRTPTNILLMWLAVSDILTMIPYIPFVVNFYCPPVSPHTHPENFSYGWVMYLLFMINFVATTHTVSIWIGVSLAAARFVQMRSTSRGPVAKERRIRHIKIVTLSVYVLSAVVMIPNYITNQVEAVQLENTTVYMLEDLQLATNHTRTVVLVNVITYAVVAKLIPCVLILIFSGSLVYTLSVQGRSRRRRLATSSSGNSKSNKRSRQATTTRMLLVVIVLFIITELPQGVLILLSATIPGFYTGVYMLLGDLMDFIALVNNAINFVLYCSMSQQFRARFAQMYLRRRVQLKGNGSEAITEKMTLRETPTRTTGAE